MSEILPTDLVGQQDHIRLALLVVQRDDDHAHYPKTKSDLKFPQDRTLSVFSRGLTFGEFIYTRDNVLTMKTIGVISDTHGVLRPEAVKALRGVDLIIHAGDVGRSDILDSLRQIAPVFAVRGNTDHEEWARTLPLTERVQVDRQLIFVLHDLHQLGLTPEVHGIAAVINGHSHKPTIEKKRGVLYLNPGSAGPRRFHLPVSVAIIRVTARGLEPKIIKLRVADK
jgi:uncharacterized protein